MYAFGVLVWELFVGDGSLPYAQMSDEQVLDLARLGTLLPLSLRDEAAAPLRLCVAVENAWHMDPRRRPTFVDMKCVLEQCMSECEI